MGPTRPLGRTSFDSGMTEASFEPVGPFVERVLFSVVGCRHDRKRKTAIAGEPPLTTQARSLLGERHTSPNNTGDRSTIGFS